MAKILLVEDDLALALELSSGLSKAGYQISHAKNLREADQLLEQRPDLIVLDWNLPDGEGLTWLIQRRRDQLAVPVIFLTARSDLQNKLAGLEMGANDYITKPFEMLELLVRIRVHLGQTVKNFADAHIIELEGFKFDLPALKYISVKGEAGTLAPLEADLIKFLFLRRGQVFTREELLEKVWKVDPGLESRAVDNVVSQLRKKFGGSIIETVRGMGYRIVKA